MNRILITEDDPFIAGIYETEFRAEGFEVTVAADGRSAMRQMSASPPDVVLLDLMLPEVNGVEVLKFIRAQVSLRDIPVIVLSSAMGKDALQLALKAGASRVLTKASCTPRHVIDEVRSSLAERKPRIATPAAGQSEAALRAALQNRVPGLVTQLRPIVDRIVNNDSSSFGPDLLELHRAMHAVSTTAALAGFGTLAQMASALELLLVELRTSPEKANSSTVHTMNQAVAFMSVLIERKGSEEYEPLSPLILVVDDDELSREVLCLALERASLRAVSLGDPALASRLLEECGFDLVFLDVNMPGMNGFEVCRNLRANPMNAQTPVVFVTALADFETRVQSRWMGVTDFVAKPIVLSELPVKALLYLLGSRVGWDGVPSGVDIATTNAAHSHPAKAAAAPASLARA